MEEEAVAVYPFMKKRRKEGLKFHHRFRLLPSHQRRKLCRQRKDKEGIAREETRKMERALNDIDESDQGCSSDGNRCATGVETVRGLLAVGGRGGMAEGTADIASVLSTIVAWVFVVANCEVWGNISTGVGKTAAGAVLGVAADGGGALPHNLGEVADFVENRRWHICLTVIWLICTTFVIVEKRGDDSGDVST